jgi:AAA15 family ATPase/GTPase
MKISKIHLTNFKRFNDLRIENIPNTAKLVLLIGSNGSGKSSLFDAFGFIDGAIKQDISLNDTFWNYFKKDTTLPVSAKIQFDDNNEYLISNNNFSKPKLTPNAFYGRTSFRQISRLTRTALGQDGVVDFQKDSDRPKFFIDRDSRFENDIEKMTEDILREFFISNQSNEQIKKKYIEPINKAFENIFGDNNGTKLQLVAIIPPLEGKVSQIIFTKGKAEFPYNYLGAGEKEIFNLIINLLSRTALYQDTIYYLDEIDLHLNTSLQFNLLKEITENWIPENCQLWTASHSLGFIEYAKQAEQAEIIDFDDLDFDSPRILSPEPKDNPDIYEIAVGKDFLPSLFKQMRICFVENKDRDYYATIGIPKTIFVSDSNRNSVYHKVRTMQMHGIVDRDFLSDDDITVIAQQYTNLYILGYYSIENYMYHPDNLEEYYQSKNLPFDKKEYISQLILAKNQAKDAIMLQIALVRSSYAYFGEPQFNDKPLQNRFKNKQENYDQSAAIQSYLNSDELEIFYKSLPMKTYCTYLVQRQHIPKSDLVKTHWFKHQIEKILNK